MIIHLKQISQVADIHSMTLAQHAKKKLTVLMRISLLHVVIADVPTVF